MSLIMAFIAHTFYFRKNRSNSGPTEGYDQKEESSVESHDEIPHARLSHFAAQLGHMQMRSSLKN